jgi:thiamine-monophosphate kinase
VYKPTVGKIQLLTTDAFIEGVHFDLTFTSCRHLGWKAIVANISDVAAMGGIPRYCTATISLPKKISVEMVEDLYKGMLFACKKYSCLLVGGDTTTSLANLMISITMTGEAREEQVLYRSGAKPGDLICVTGHLGASHAGLKILQRNKQLYMQSNDKDTFQPSLELYKIALEKHLMPKPRLDISKILVEHVKIHSLIDISDGLASEVHHICLNSEVGAQVYERNIPLDSVTQKIASEFSESPIDYALYGGEEYELLLTLADDQFEILDKLTDDITIIGRITEKNKGVDLVRENGETEPLRFGGWDHFKK